MSLSPVRFSGIYGISLSSQQLKKYREGDASVSNAIGFAVKEADTGSKANPDPTTIVDLGDTLLAMSQGDKKAYEDYQEVMPAPSLDDGSALHSYMKAFLKSQNKTLADVPTLYVNA